MKRLPSIWLVFALAIGCGSVGSTGAPEPVSLKGVARHHVPSFEALAAAVGSRENQTARGILQILERRVAAEEAAGQTQATRSARVLMRGYASILGGRDRAAAVRFELDCRPAADGQDEVVLVLRSTSSWTGTLGVGPVAGNLRSTLVSLDALGRESNDTHEYGVTLAAWDLPTGVSEIVIESVRLNLPAGALAGRHTFALSLRAGEWVDGARRYPAQALRVEPTQRFLLAAFLPQGAVEPQELVSYCDRLDLAAIAPERVMPPLLERTVRVDPRRHAEALELFKPLVARFTPDEIRRIVPSLRWLSRSAGGERDPLLWKRALTATAAADPATARGDLDMPQD